MFKRWEKIDIFIGILFVLTNISYIFFSRDVFKLFLWMLIIVATLRILYILRKKLFWKVRNRLIFSSLFLIATPLLFIFFFFLVILNIIMAQYGMVIMDNLLNQQLSQLEKTASYYLDQKSPKMPLSIKMWEKMDPGFLNIARFEREESENTRTTTAGTSIQTNTGTFKNVYNPNHLDLSGLTLEEFSGYFLLKDKLYLGCFKNNDTRAILLCFIVNQAFLDQFAAISDFRMRYQTPLKNKLEDLKDAVEYPQLMNDEGFFSFPFPWVFKYKYLDFNETEGSSPREKTSHFWLFLNFKKIWDKIPETSSNKAQTDVEGVIWALGVIFGLFIIGSFVIGIRSIMVITRSINLITKGTQRIRNGDFSFRIKTKSGDQLQYLGESFNEMAAGIDRLLIDEKEKQRLEEELRIARSIQLKLLPPDRFETEEFEIAAVNIPAAEIAGDYFDYFYKENDYLSILVADVSGKGASAAFYMAELKGVINHLQKTEITPSALIGECHDSLNDSFDRVTFITINLAKFFIPERKFQLARAGHTPALFYSAEEKECLELYPEGMGIGLINFSREKIKEIAVNYKKGDILFLFSDGLSEIMNSREEMLGMESLKEIITENSHLPAEEIKQKLLDFSIKFSESEITRDDLTFIILKVKK